MLIYVRQKLTLLGYKGVTVNMDNAYEAVKPRLHKIGNHVAYEFLQVFNVVILLIWTIINSTAL